MLQELWNYFLKTGDINLYLGFKEYESLYNSRIEALPLQSTQEVEEMM
ncbi:hypothetical protein [Sporanaerobium hydrogeniformans]|nr:hypothetical protein [Sporanaerobium hydrogeniformans]